MFLMSIPKTPSCSNHLSIMKNSSNALALLPFRNTKDKLIQNLSGCFLVEIRGETLWSEVAWSFHLCGSWFESHRYPIFSHRGYPHFPWNWSRDPASQLGSFACHFRLTLAKNYPPPLPRDHARLSICLNLSLITQLCQQLRFFLFLFREQTIIGRKFSGIFVA